MMLDGLYGTLTAGGWVMLPIFLVGAWGFYLLLSTYAAIRADLYRRDFKITLEKIRARLLAGDQVGAEAVAAAGKGVLSKSLEIVLRNRHLSERALRRLLEEKLSLLLHPLDSNLPLVAVLAAAAPLLGLLGTVTGMVHTFDVITVHGNRNPVLLADGISEALITTQSGLLIAFPLLLLRHRLSDRITWLNSQVELGVSALLNQIYRHQQNA